MDYPNTGSLWPLKERTSDKSPNVRGSIKLEVDFIKHLLENADGFVEMEVAGWTKEWKDTKFLTLKVSEPYKKKAPNTSSKSDDDSDVPF